MAQDDVITQPLEAPSAPVPVPDAPVPRELTQPSGDSYAERLMGVYGNQMEHYNQQESDLLKQKQQALQAEKQRMQGVITERAPRIQQMITDAQQPALSPEQTHDLQTPTPMPQAPAEQKPIVDREEFKSFFGVAFVMAMALGKFARADMVDGLNMLSSALTGYTTGAKDKAAEDLQQYKVKMEAALNAEREKINRYDAIIRAKNLDLQGKLNALKLEATRDDDQQMLYNLEMQNIDGTLKIIEQAKQRLTTVMGQASRMYTSAQTNMMREDIAADNLEYKKQAHEDLQSHREAELEIKRLNAAGKAQESMNKAVMSYNTRFQRIAERYASRVQNAITKSGNNKPIVLAEVQSAAAMAAEEMKGLNAQFQQLSWVKDGQTYRMQDALGTMHDSERPGYWMGEDYMRAKGIKEFIPQVGSVPSAPSQVDNSPVQNPPIAGEEPAQPDENGVILDKD